MPHWEMFQSIIPAMHIIAMIAMHIYMSTIAHMKIYTCKEHVRSLLSCTSSTQLIMQ